MDKLIDKEKDNNILALSTIIKIIIPNDIDDLLKTYAFFLTSSPDTLYNISYYTDRINKFKESITEFKRRYILYESILIDLQNIIYFDDNLTLDSYLLEFDEIFQYKFEWQLDKPTLNFSEEKVNQFRIDSVTFLPYTFRCIINSDIDCLYCIDRTNNQGDVKSEESIKSKIKANLKRTIKIANQNNEKQQLIQENT